MTSSPSFTPSSLQNIQTLLREYARRLGNLAHFRVIKSVPATCAIWKCPKMLCDSNGHAGAPGEGIVQVATGAMILGSSPQNRAPGNSSSPVWSLSVLELPDSRSFGHFQNRRHTNCPLGSCLHRPRNGLRVQAAVSRVDGGAHFLEELYEHAMPYHRYFLSQPQCVLATSHVSVLTHASGSLRQGWAKWWYSSSATDEKEHVPPRRPLPSTHQDLLNPVYSKPWSTMPSKICPGHHWRSSQPADTTQQVTPETGARSN